MSDVSPWEYLAVLAATSALTLILTPLALRQALRRQIVDAPGDYKIQESPVPYLGGLAIVLSFATVIGLAAVIRPPHTGLGEVLMLLGLAAGLALMGLIDDLKNLSPILRLALEIGAALVVFHSDIAARVTNIGWFDAVITVAWIVGVTNALNFLDNMDGLSAGVSGIAALSFFVIAATNGQFLVATLALALVGCAAGFLRSNFHPARIYMGDAGALFLGFMLAVLGLKLQFDVTQQVTVFVPILVMGVALFDTSLVVCTRLLHRRNPMVGARDHTSHRLVFVGLPVRAAVGVIYGASAALGWLAIVMVRVDQTASYLLMGLVLTSALVLGLVLGAVPVYASSKRRRMMLQEVVNHEGDPPDRAAVEEAEVRPFRAEVS